MTVYICITVIVILRDISPLRLLSLFVFDDISHVVLLEHLSHRLCLFFMPLLLLK